MHKNTKQKVIQRNNAVNKIQEEEPFTCEKRDNSWNSDSINIRYLVFDRLRSVMFTKLEASTSQKESNYEEVDTGSKGNKMPFRVFKILFPVSTTAKLCITKCNTVMLKTYKHRETRHVYCKNKTQG